MDEHSEFKYKLRDELKNMQNEIPKDMLNGMCIHFEVSTIDIW